MIKKEFDILTNAMKEANKVTGCTDHKRSPTNKIGRVYEGFDPEGKQMYSIFKGNKVSGELFFFITYPKGTMQVRKNGDPEALKIGRVIRDVRDDRELTLDEMKRLTGLNKQTLIGIEQGKGSNFNAVLKYLKALRLNIKIEPEKQ